MKFFKSKKKRVVAVIAAFTLIVNLIAIPSSATPTAAQGHYEKDGTVSKYFMNVYNDKATMRLYCFPGYPEEVSVSEDEVNSFSFGSYGLYNFKVTYRCYSTYANGVYNFYNIYFYFEGTPQDLNPKVISTGGDNSTPNSIKYKKV